MEGGVSLPISRSRREADRSADQSDGAVISPTPASALALFALFWRRSWLIRLSSAGGYGQLRSPACPPADEIREEGSPPPGPPSGFLHLQRSPAYHHLKDGK